ncbi:MAG: MFS transporter, partial [Planctomycetes bacterium]|nr:MFS transporter [Planctomycetota bacterium]
PMWGAVTDISGRAAATVFGTVNMVGSLGGVASNPTFGYVKQHYGWSTVFWLIAAVYVISAVCWFWVNTTRPLVVDDTDGEGSSSDASR